jgi:hypothetical protein
MRRGLALGVCLAMAMCAETRASGETARTGTPVPKWLQEGPIERRWRQERITELAEWMSHAHPCSDAIRSLRAQRARPIWTCGAAPPAPVVRDINSSGIDRPITLSLKDFRLRDLVGNLQEQGMLSRSLRFDADTQDRITIQALRPIGLDDLCPLILGQIQVMGLRAEPQSGGEVRVTAPPGHVSCDAGVMVTRDPEDLASIHSALVVIALLDAISAQDAVSLLEPMADSETLILAPPQGHIVFLIGSPSNLQPLLQALNDAGG